MIECKFVDLFDRDVTGMVMIGNYQPGLKTLFSLKPKNAGLNYDINTRLKNAVDERAEELYKSLNELNEEYAVEKEVETAAGEKKKTKFVLVDLPKTGKDKKEQKEYPKEKIVAKVNGKPAKKLIVDRYDIPEEKMKEFDEKVTELLKNDIELNCNPIKLSKLEKEEDTSSVEFQWLNKFIVDDTEGE